MPGYGAWNWIPEEINGIPSVYWILIFAAVIIGVLIVLSMVYFIIYKIRINKSLDAEKRIGRPLITPLTVAVASGIVVWIASTILVIVILHVLATFSAQNSNYIIDNYRNIVTLTQKIDEQNITNDYTTKLGNVHADTKTIDMTISLSTQLVLGKDDKLTFRIGDSKTELKKGDDGRYAGTVQVSVFDEYPTGILTLESEGETFSQFIATTPLIFADHTERPETVQGNEWMELYPHAEFDTANVNVSKDGDKTRLEGSLEVMTFCAEKDTDMVFTELTLVLAVNDKTFRMVDLMKDSNVSHSGDTYIYTLDETVEKGEIDYYLMAKDSEGNSYTLFNGAEYILNSDEYEPDTPMDDDITADTEGTYSTITDKNGNVLKRFVLYS